jgi:hypothetical protein
VLFACKESDVMMQKKAGSKQPVRSRLSLASRLLGNTVRATLPVPAAQEPWRNRKPKGKKR